MITARIATATAPWISERLGELGVDVADILVVGDRAADLEAGLAFLAEQGCDLIVTSGGLGPTADDLTAEVVARFAGVELVLDEAMERRIAEIVADFARRLRFDPEALRVANRKQAMVPAGAEALDPVGTAPGLVVRTERGPVVVVLPGPPRSCTRCGARRWRAPARARSRTRAAVRDRHRAHVRGSRVRAGPVRCARSERAST